jgi:sentrin-specific protease 7
VVTLREYLTCELREKTGKHHEFNRVNMKGHCPKVPQQPNSYDCGLFMLQYAESFFRVRQKRLASRVSTSLNKEPHSHY